jgi:hypothetical protein
MDQPATNEPATKNATFRGACITHYGEAWTALPEKMQYLGFSQESCPTTNRIHYQAWAYSKIAMRLTAWKKAFPGDHIEQMRGTFAQNDRYCSKQNEMTHFGERPMENGKKRSLVELTEAIIDAAQSGTPIEDVVTLPDHAPTYVQYHNGIRSLYQMAVTKKARSVDRDFAPEVFYYWGPPGSGKTRKVYELEPDIYKVSPCDGYKWKDNYSGQDAVLYDNVSCQNITSPERFLMEIDRYYSQLPVKGGFIGWRPKRIYITSVVNPAILASTVAFSLPGEFLRRVTSVTRFPECMEIPAPGP